MTATYQTRYISVVKCDGHDCDNYEEQDHVIFDHPGDAEDHGKNHVWASDGESHYCDQCWCDECDEPVTECAHATAI